MEKLNILVLGDGGREHTFCWKIAQSTMVRNLFAAPGNAGTADIATNLNIGVNDFDALKNAALRNNIDLLIVGPEEPLVNGIHDFFLADPQLKDISVIGPKKLGATLEGSKEFAKAFMSRHNIPTAQYGSFTAENIEKGIAFLDQMTAPYVLKADGLAGGKGVLIINELDIAKKELYSMLLDQKFGKASRKVIIEEFLCGIELSCFVLTDGLNYVTFPMAKDYKRIGEGDTGLNTGGMGAVSPVPIADKKFYKDIQNTIIKPTIEGLKKDKIPYVGFLFIGLIRVDDKPYVIEYNVRMGDPETQVVLPRIKNDFVELLNATARGKLDEVKLQVDEKSATTVVAVSGGYPEAYKKGKIIKGLPKASNSTIFHAGTKIYKDNILTDGGRVLSVTSVGENFEDALKQNYKILRDIRFEGIYFRRDIGFDL